MRKARQRIPGGAIEQRHAPDRESVGLSSQGLAVPQLNAWRVKRGVRSLAARVMAEALLSLIMDDGSRHFGDLPQTVLWYELRDHIGKSDGAAITGFVTDHVTGALIDFTYSGAWFLF